MKKNLKSKPEARKDKISIIKKTIKSIPKKLKNKTYIRNIIAAISISMASSLITSSLHSCSANTKPIDVESENNYYSIALANDLPDDDYDNSIPLKLKSGNIQNINANQIVIVNGDIKSTSNEVFTLDSDGNKIEGSIDGIYLTNVLKIEKNLLNKYNEIYRIKPTIPSVNLRTKPIIENDTKITEIKGGQYVLADLKTLTNDNDFFWYPVMYPNENGISFGYIREDLLEKVTEQDNTYSEQDNTQDNQNEDSQSQNNQDQSDNEKTYNMIVNTSIDNEIDLNLRSTGEINDNNIVTTIPHGSLVQTTGEKQIMNSIEWIKISYTDKSNKTYTGWVVSSYLEEIIEKEMIVDTSSDGNIDLNVRDKPNIEGSKIIAQIKNGTKLKILQKDFDNKTTDSNNFEWVRVQLSDNTSGYIATKYLIENNKPEINESEINKPQSAYSVNISKNNSGTVSGIDISGMSPQNLRNLLSQNDSQIPSTIYDPYDETITNISKASGKINFVYIKIGASSYGANCPFQVLDNDLYREQAKICEEFGIPYGFYYYSTCINNDEAMQEKNYITKAIDSLDNFFENSLGHKPVYNILPIAIDMELGPEGKDRQSDVDIEKTSRAKAFLANKLYSELGNAILYTSGRHTDISNNDAIINIETFNNNTEKNIDIWHVSRYNPDGNIMSAHQQYRNNLQQSNNIIADQIKLDISLSDGSIVDLNVMDYNTFKKYIQNSDLSITEETRQEDYEFDN